MKDNLAYKLIDEILWNDWDPIGVNEYQQVRDEYYSYIPMILHLKVIGSDQETIAQHLLQIETEQMEVTGNIEICRRIAKLIDEIKL